MFNFWEPLHYLAHNHGFQTWELSPSFAIRSWAYVATFLPALETIPQFMGLGKVRHPPFPLGTHLARRALTHVPS